MADMSDALGGKVTRLKVAGMTCASCVGQVERALAAVPGVHKASVDLRTGSATIWSDPQSTSDVALSAALAGAGYAVAAPGPKVARPLPWQPVLFALLGVAGLLGLYLGIITLAQGWEHARQQLSDDRWFVAAIATGFGAQVGLFAYLRTLHAHANAGGVATSTGTSGAAMLACCAHHLVDLLPIVGLSGAAIFLNDYKLPLLWLGIVMNAAGLAYMLRRLQQHRRLVCHQAGG
ncbi:MAG: heavy-metal-associated domain-containing protein [Chloroflexota bacterium]